MNNSLDYMKKTPFESLFHNNYQSSNYAFVYDTHSIINDANMCLPPLTINKMQNSLLIS